MAEVLCVASRAKAIGGNNDKFMTGGGSHAEVTADVLDDKLRTMQEETLRALKDSFRQFSREFRDEYRSFGKRLMEDVQHQYKPVTFKHARLSSGDSLRDAADTKGDDNSQGNMSLKAAAMAAMCASRARSNTRRKQESIAAPPLPLDCASPECMHLSEAAHPAPTLNVPVPPPPGAPVEMESSEIIQCQADEAAGGWFAASAGGEQGERVTTRSPPFIGDDDALGTHPVDKSDSQQLEEADEEEVPMREKRHRISMSREISKRAKTQKVVIPIHKMSLADILKHSKFDNLVGIVILLNAALIGAQTHYNAQFQTEEVPMFFFVCEQIFCVWFTTELTLRIYVDRCKYFNIFIAGWIWNYFDVFVVAAQLIEVAFTIIASTGDFEMGNLKLIRVMRILRLVRILRVVRVMHLIGELRAIISSIVGSFRSLIWVLVLLSLVLYIVAVYFTQAVTDHLIEMKTAPGGAVKLSEEEVLLSTFFGSLFRGILTLWQAMSGGLDWDSVAGPILVHVGLLPGMLFAAFIAFAILALMNVVTGVFVQTALQSARQEEDSFMTDQIIKLFNINERTNKLNTIISLQEITECLEDPATAKEWKSIGVEAEDARYLFRLLDIEGTGNVPFEEFMGGCLRLSGTAKSIDLLTVMQENRRNMETIMRKHDESTSEMSKIIKFVQILVGSQGQLEDAMGILARDVNVIADVCDQQRYGLRSVQQSIKNLETVFEPMEVMHGVV